MTNMVTIRTLRIRAVKFKLTNSSGILQEIIPPPLLLLLLLKLSLLITIIICVNYKVVQI